MAGPRATLRGTSGGGAGGASAARIGSGRELFRILMLVLAVNVVVRAAAIAIFPLILTNDSIWYFRCAEELLDGRALTITKYRTPGYALWLAAILGPFGRGALPIVLAQHALATCAALALTRAAHRLGGSHRALAAMVTGIGVSLDPYLLMFNQFALSESLTVSLVCIASAWALGAGSAARRTNEGSGRAGGWGAGWAGGLGVAACVGALIGCAMLVRPAVQVMAPFLIGACVLAPGLTFRRRVAVGGVGAIVAALIVLPWLMYNARRDVPGMASGTGAILFSNLARVGVPRAEDAAGVDPELVARFAPYEGRALTEPEMWRYLHGVGALSKPEVDAALSRWAMRTMRERPLAYAMWAARACVWQMNVYPGSWRYRSSELNWFMTRIGADGTERGQRAPNFQVGALTDEDVQLLEPYRGAARDGAMLRGTMWAAERWPRGVPQVVLAACALVGAWLAFRRGAWAVLAVLAGTAVFIVFHGLLVFPFARYSLPAVAVWYVAAGQVAAAAVAGVSARRERRRARAIGPAPAAQRAEG